MLYCHNEMFSFNHQAQPVLALQLHEDTFQKEEQSKATQMLEAVGLGH
jgi:hypothetical protein